MICTICMEVINEGDEVQQLPCGHKLHSVCASEWRRTARISNLFQCPIWGVIVRPRRSLGSDRTLTDSLLKCGSRCPSRRWARWRSSWRARSLGSSWRARSLDALRLADKL